MNLEDRVSQLEQTQRDLEELAIVESAQSRKREAKFQAAMTMLAELFFHAGASERQFLAHFEALVEFYDARLLEIAEDINPNFAARTDNRPPGADAAPELPQPILPPRNQQ
jgi:hypothetical protein